jgi:Tol biopolymer transport system component
MLVLGIIFMPGLLQGTDRILVAFPNRDDESDLYLLKPGQAQDDGTLLAENLIEANDVYVWYRAANELFTNPGSQYAMFIPGTNRLLYWAQEDDEARVNAITIGEEAAYEVIATSALPLYTLAFENSDYLFVQETREDQERCYAGKFGEDPLRLGKGDFCWFVWDGNHSYSQEVDNAQTTFTLIGMDGEDEITLLNEAESIAEPSLSQDGSHLAYVEETDDGQQLYLLPKAESTPTAVGTEVFALLSHAFIPKQDTLYYLAENEDGEVELYLSDKGLVATGSQIAAASDQEGKYLVYQVADDDGEMTLFSRPINGDASVEILRNDGLEFNLVPTAPAKMIIRVVEQDETTLYTADLDGGNLIEVFNETNIASTSLFYIPEGKTLFIGYEEEDGATFLYVTPLGTAEGFPLVEEWDSLEVMDLTPDGKTLLLTGREDAGDDPVLYSLAVEAGASLTQLDDDSQGFYNAVFTKNGKDVIYTAITGDNPDDVEIYQVPVDGSESRTSLYQEARLEDVQWTQMYPFRRVWWQSPVEGTSYCPGASALAVGDARENRMPSGESQCYRFHASAGAFLSFDVDTIAADGHDLTLTLYDRDGNTLAYNDDDPFGRDPQLSFLASAGGVYFAMVAGYEEVEVPYTLKMLEGPVEASARDAQRMENGSRLRGAITDQNGIRLERHDFDGYGVFYYYDGKDGETITIDVYAESLGSTFDARIILLNAAFDDIYEDEDSGNGNEAHLVYMLPENNRYYFLVTGPDGGEYGTETDFFYEIALTVTP